MDTNAPAAISSIPGTPLAAGTPTPSPIPGTSSPSPTPGTGSPLPATGPAKPPSSSAEGEPQTAYMPPAAGGSYVRNTDGSLTKRA